MNEVNCKGECVTYLFNHLCLNDIPEGEQLRLQFIEVFRRLTLIEEKMNINYIKSMKEVSKQNDRSVK